MKVTMLTGSLSRLGGGVSEIVNELSLSLSNKNVDVSVIGLNDKYRKKDASRWDFIKDKVYSFRSFTPIQYNYNISTQLKHLDPDILHQHGLWMYNSYVNYSWKKRLRKRNMISLQGMLDPWAFKYKNYKKKIFWSLFEKRNLNSIDCINANTYKEFLNIRDLGLKNPVCIIPNGVTLSSFKNDGDPIWKNFWSPDVKILLFLGRIHPKKGLLELIEAFRLLKEKKNSQDWVLAIVGWDQNNFGKQINELIYKYRLCDKVKWFGPAFSKEKQILFQNASAFILPSFSEGLPMAVLEAWSFNLPVLITPECNLEDAFDFKAAIKIDPNPESIFEGINKLINMTQLELNIMGENGLKLIEKKFTWDRVGEEMNKVYKWLLEGGEKPDSVLF